MRTGFLSLVGEPGFEPGVTRSQTEHVSRYTTPRMQGAVPLNMKSY